MCTACARQWLGYAALIPALQCAHLLGKQRALRRVLRATGHTAAQAVYVGDQVADWEAAQTVGLPFAAVAWGYAHPEVFAGLAGTQLIERVDALLGLAE
ncbi:HAD family hydrolase [Xanthomonas euroxanthea]|uniref:HAD family hydrolase n=1 Tax=Xanthomonas euroxanthea TaxID=2259622 RepID=A0AA46C5M1_9XANT|nr:HAD family hydrolase [Xanthomonas euroxanthea]